MKEIYKEYFRNNLPHIWCSGCGNGIVMSAWARAMDQMGLDKNKCVGVSGIGCSSRITGYLDMDTLHTAHGRALPFASGVKMAKPELNVFVFSGDGDAAAIGGNHFIHACRRDIDLTMIIFNNHIYGMTGGQVSPLTPRGKKTTTTPYGTVNLHFDLCDLAIGAGCSFVARGDIFHAKQLTDLIVEAHMHKGMSVLEVMAICPVSYGRRNKMANPADMINDIKEHTVSKARADKMSPEELADKIVTGVLYQREPIEFTSEYANLMKRGREVANNG